MTEISPRTVYLIMGVVLLLFVVAYFKPSSTSSSNGCLDVATAKPALDEAASELDAAVRAGKVGDTATAAAHMRSAAASLRAAASAWGADPDVSKLLTVAADGYGFAATAHANGDEGKAAKYASNAVAFVEASTAALRKSRVPCCQ
jgi:hypothetical protein